jgi:integrase
MVGLGKGRVFLSAQGKEYRQAPTVFRDVVEELGLNEGRGKLDRQVFHSLRHSGATRLGQSGIPLRDMMDLAGWKTPSMALRYQHSGDAGRRRAMKALEGMMHSDDTKVVDLNYRK